MTVADPQSFNRYTYVNNDPVNKVDPLGLLMMGFNGNSGESSFEDILNYAKAQILLAKQYEAPAWVGDNSAPRQGGENEPPLDPADTVTIDINQCKDQAPGVSCNSDGSRVDSVSNVTDRPSRGGYWDINITFLSHVFIGPTGGVMINDEGKIHPYLGVAVGFPRGGFRFCDVQS